MNVLIIEGESVAAELLQMGLSCLGCHVRQARGWADGVAQAALASPELIIVEAESRGAALAALRGLRAAAATRHHAIYLHSAHLTRSGQCPEADALSVGFLPKPLRARQLQHVLAETQFDLARRLQAASLSPYAS